MWRRRRRPIARLDAAILDARAATKELAGPRAVDAEELVEAHGTAMLIAARRVANRGCPDEARARLRQARADGPAATDEVWNRLVARVLECL